jgi:6,7-dimethyl-8-ribityllumazine synthase
MKYLRTLALTLLAATAVAALGQSRNADDVYRDAQGALTRQDFARAIDGLRALRRDFPTSRYVADSFYWEALALERSGNLEGAVQALNTQLREHPDAATAADARGRRVQICAELASTGNRDCAVEIAAVVRDPTQVDADLRLYALNALQNMRAERALPIATAVLNDRSQPEELRRQALFIIADKGEESTELQKQALDTLLSTSRDATDSMEIRKQAIFWLSELEGEETLSALQEIVSNSNDEELLKSAIFAIAEQDSAQAAALLRELAENEALGVEVRKQAIYWLAEEYEEQAVPFLTDLYGKLEDAELKKQVLFAIGETEADTALAWLLDRAGDSRETLEVRKQALFWANEAGLPAAQLRGLYRSAAERELREHIIWLISESEDDSAAALDMLIEIARSDPDREMRSKAVFWIGESDDPRAEQLLLEILGQGGRR